MEAKLKEVRDDKAQAAEQKALLEEKIALLNEQISNTEAVIAEYDGLISEKETEIVQLEQQQADQYALFCQQVRDMEEQGSVSYLAIIFSASTFTEMLDNIMMVSEVMEYHNSVIDALRETQEQLEQTKTELEAARAEQEELKAEQEVNKAELLEQEAEVEALIAQISALEADYQEELDRYEAASDQLDDQLAAAERSMRNSLRRSRRTTANGTGPCRDATISLLLLPHVSTRSPANGATTPATTSPHPAVRKSTRPRAVWSLTWGITAFTATISRFPTATAIPPSMGICAAGLLSMKGIR